MDQQPDAGRRTILANGVPGGAELFVVGADPAHAAVVGRVTRADGSPVGRAALILANLAGEHVDRAWTDGNGAYQLVPPISGTYLLVCAAGANTPAVALLTVADVTLHRDIELTGAGSLTGCVRVESTKYGLPGALVTVLEAAGNVVATTMTDAEGRYRVDELPENTYTLVIASEHSRPTAFTVTVTAGVQTQQDIQLDVHARLFGTVRSAATGKPIEEALVTLIDADGTVLNAVTTGAKGDYLFEELPEGTYTLTATGYPPVTTLAQLSTGASSSTDLSLYLPRGGA